MKEKTMQTEEEENTKEKRFFFCKNKKVEKRKENKGNIRVYTWKLEWVDDNNCSKVTQIH